MEVGKIIKSILCVFAHPDDEFFVAGLLKRAKRYGLKTHLLCCTRGERGRVFDRSDVELYKRIEIRKSELRSSVELLGIDSFRQLKFEDGEGENWDTEVLSLEILHMIDQTNADVVITFSPDGGVNKHQDHKMISSVITKLHYENSSKFELYYSRFPYMKNTNPYGETMYLSNIFNLVEINNDYSVLDLNRDEIFTKEKVIDSYRSQFPKDGKYFYQDKSVIFELSKIEIIECKNSEQTVLLDLISDHEYYSNGITKRINKLSSQIA